MTTLYTVTAYKSDERFDDEANQMSMIWCQGYPNHNSANT